MMTVNVLHTEERKDYGGDKDFPVHTLFFQFLPKEK